MPLFPPTPAIVQPGTHDCYFEYVDANTCRLTRFGGNKLMINGVLETIPSAGVTLAGGATLAAYPFLYIYAINSGPGTPMLLTYGIETPVLDAYGMPKNSNVAWGPSVLVGMVLGGLATFQQNNSIIGVVSYWNRRMRQAAAGTSVSSGSTSAIELHTAYRVTWVGFAGDHVRAQLVGAFSNSIAAAITIANLASTAGGGPNVAAYNPVAVNSLGALGQHLDAQNVAAGNHYATVQGWVGSGVGTWNWRTQVMVDG